MLDESRHRAGSVLIVGWDQTLWLTAAAIREARRQLLMMAHKSIASSALDAVLRVPG